jgi:hypothetical protein
MGVQSIFGLFSQLSWKETTFNTCKDLLEEGRKQQQIYQDTLQMGDKAASFQKLRKLKSDIDQMKTIEVSRLYGILNLLCYLLEV